MVVRQPEKGEVWQTVDSYVPHPLVEEVGVRVVLIKTAEENVAFVLEPRFKRNSLRPIGSKRGRRNREIEPQDRIILSGVLLRGDVVSLIDKKAIVADRLVRAQSGVPEMPTDGCGALIVLRSVIIMIAR